MKNEDSSISAFSVDMYPGEGDPLSIVKKIKYQFCQIYY